MNNAQALIDNYKQAYQLLNKQQKQAVDTIQGPVMVLAGPGTGKTQILSVRIAHMLQSDMQIAPQNILCLTFTDAGKIAMRTRLQQMIGVETAQQIAIHTFHSFSNEVIQQNKHLFNKDILENITDLEQHLLVEDLLSKLPTEHRYSNARQSFSNTKSLLKLFSTMKKENWTPAFLLEKIEEYRTQFMLQTGDYIYSKAAKKGEYKQTYFDDLEKLEKLQDAIKLYDSYIKLMFESQRYDYDDMIQWVIRAFADMPDLLARYKETFQYFLVDEYQDTNGSQNALVYSLCDDNEDNAPNLFVVGDDDQSIYRFQGASAENMQSILTKYPRTLQINLITNYRSTTEIVNQSLAFIKNNNDRIKDDAVDFNSHRGANTIEPTTIGLQNSRQELIYITKQIQALVHQGIEPHEIAVLFTKNEHCLRLAKYLNAINIPIHINSKADLLQMPFSKSLLNILRYFVLEADEPYSGDGLLFKLLHAPYFNTTALQLARAAYACRQQAIAKDITKNSFREYLHHWSTVENVAQFTDAPPTNIIQAYTKLENLLALSQHENVYPFFVQLLKDLNINKYMLNSKDKIALIDELTALLQWLETECHLHPEKNLKQFLKTIDDMEDLEIKQKFTTTIGKDNGVQLLTIHGSKGLEFKYVFVAHTTSNNWESKPNSNRYGFTLPFNIFTHSLPITISGHKEYKEFEKKQQLKDLRRLMYVAATRAKDKLVFTYHRTLDNGKDSSASALLSEFFKTINIKDTIDNEAVSTNDLISFEPVDIIQLDKPSTELLEQDIIKEKLQDFVLNVSALNKYLKCPLSFYYTNILRVPEGINARTSFGDSIHQVLKFAYEDLAKNKGEFPTEAELINHFEKKMYKSKEKFTKEEYKKKIEWGTLVIKNLAAQILPTSNKIVKVEYEVKDVNYKGIPLKGFLDKLEFNGNDVVIVDYKTGIANSTYNKANLDTPLNLNTKAYTKKGGDYWRQGAFYTLLLQLNKADNYIPKSAAFFFVEPLRPSLEFITAKFEYNNDEMEVLKSQIETAWQGIQNQEFTTGCGKEDCEWCSLLSE
jgi:DNA helicase II / ATP-dependent DNA helicase PcrA